MTIQSLGYSIILVEDYSVMKQWYERSLGLELAEADDEGKWATFRFPDGGAEIAIHSVPGRPVTRGNSVIPCIEVSDINVAMQELKSRGVNFVKGVHGDTVLLANFNDPEGNMLQLFQRAGGV